MFCLHCVLILGILTDTYAQELLTSPLSTTTVILPNSKIPVRVGVAAIRDPTGSVGWVNCGGAIGIAIDKFSELNITKNYDFQLFVKETTCEGSDAVGIGIEFMTKTMVDVVIAPPCRDGAMMMAHLSTIYSTAALAWGYVSDDEFSDSDKYPWWTSIIAASQTLSASAQLVLQEFGWNTVAMLYATDQFGYCSSIMNSIMNVLASPDGNVVNIAVLSEIVVTDNDMMVRVMERVRLRARIILLCFNTVTDRRKFLIKASDLNMMSDDYQYIVVSMRSLGFGQPALGRQTLNSGLTPFWEDINGTIGDGKDEVVKQAARKLLIVDLSSEVKDDAFLKKFTSTVAMRVLQPPLNCRSDDCLNNTAKAAGRYARHLYDAFYLYGTSLYKVANISSASAITNAMVTSFSGFSGLTGEVEINVNSTRVGLYYLYGIDAQYQQVEYMEINFRTNIANMTKYYTDADSTVFANRGGVRPLDEPLCGYSGLTCPESFMRKYFIYLIVGAALIIIVVITLLVSCIILCTNRAREKERLRLEWQIPSAHLLEPTKGGSGIGTSHRSFTSSLSNTPSNFDSDYFDVRVYDKESVLISIHPRVQLSLTEFDTCGKLRRLDHDNVNKFIGLSIDSGQYIKVYRMCDRGSLQNVISSGSMSIDPFFILCITRDVAEGLNYIHHSFVTYVGTLTSATCLVSQGWQVKISEYGLHALSTKKSQNDLLWTAPELLRSPAIGGTKPADIYAFAIICSEVITKQPAWNLPNREEQGDELLYRIKRGGVMSPRPDLTTEGCMVDEALLDLVKECWREDPQDRPQSQVVCKRLRGMLKGSKNSNLMDHLFAILEEYTEGLEREVEEQSREVVEQKKKADLLLSRMLPRQVAERLKRGQSVEPEGFDSVSVFFSDVVKFTQHAARCSPLQVVALLNELYGSFDNIIEQQDAYKVESIGDGYLCVSGLPMRNGFNHVREITEMSLNFMKYVDQFQTPYLYEKIQLRIGINSGPCVAGVVGLSQPRYCLFGDTVNTASRMESNGKPSHIHISSSTQELIEKHFPKSYNLVSRGEVLIKGKGVMETFWIEGRASEGKGGTTKSTVKAAEPPAAVSSDSLQAVNGLKMENETE